MAISVEKILEKSPHQYFKDSKKIQSYNLKPLSYSMNFKSKQEAKEYLAKEAPCEAEVVLDFKYLDGYKEHIVFGVALIPKK